MSRTFFVTGTDTEVGKTAVCCALLQAARAAGMRTAAIKPVAAGCDESGRNEDALQLQACMTERMAYNEVNPVALAEAIAPHLAAAHEGVNLRVDALAEQCRAGMAAEADLVLVEGAGGWRVPLGPGETLADLAVALQLDVILVVGMRLGCINHALLTSEAIRRDGLNLAGWVANEPGERMACYEENLDTLRSLLPAPLLGEIPRLSPFDPAVAAGSLSLRGLPGL
jgi:dethiobiotin synthetase